MILAVVDLPQPDSPMIPRVSPPVDGEAGVVHGVDLHRRPLEPAHEAHLRVETLIDPLYPKQFFHYPSSRQQAT